MAYTPPLGTAVDFQFSGLAYTPPAGTAVDFTFATTGAAAFDVPYDFAVSGVIGFDGVATVAFDFTVASEASHGVGVAAQFDVDFLFAVSGGTTVSGEGVFDAPFNVAGLAIVGDGVAFGNALLSLTLTSGAVGIVYPAGVGQIDVPISVETSGQLAPLGVANARLLLSPSVVGNFTAPYIGTVKIDATVVVAGWGNVGRKGDGNVLFQLEPVAFGKTGLSGVGNVEVHIELNAVSSHGVVGGASALLQLYAIATPAVGSFDTTYVKTSRKNQVVFV